MRTIPLSFSLADSLDIAVVVDETMISNSIFGDLSVDDPMILSSIDGIKLSSMNGDAGHVMTTTRDKDRLYFLGSYIA